MQDYNFIIKHIPGENNKSDVLSQCPDYDQGTHDNTNVTVLPLHLFVQTTTLSCLFSRATTLSSIDERVRTHQLRQPEHLKKWATTYPLKQTGELHWYGDRLVIMEDTSLKRGVISQPWTCHGLHESWQGRCRESFRIHGQPRSAEVGDSCYFLGSANVSRSGRYFSNISLNSKS